MLKPIQVPILLLLQPNLLHHLTDFVLDGTVLWIVWWPWNDREIAGSNTVSHRVVNVPAVMCGEIIPNKDSMEVSAGDIVRLNIPADVVSEVMKYIGSGSSCTYTVLDPTKRAINTPSNMRRESWIPRLDGKDHGHFCTGMVVVSVLMNAQHLHGPPPRAVTFTPNSSKSINYQEEEDSPRNPRHKTDVRPLRLIYFGQRLFSA